MANALFGSKLIKTIGLAPTKQDKLGVRLNTAKIKPEFGRGNIFDFNLEGISLLIMDFFLREKVALKVTYNKNDILATYLIKGNFLVETTHLLKESLYTPFNQYLQVTHDKETTVTLFEDQHIYCVQIIFNKAYMNKYTPQFLYNHADKLFKNQITNNVVNALLNVDAIIEKKLCYHLYIESTCVNLLSMLIESFKCDKKTPNTNASYIKLVYNIKKQIDENIDSNYTINTLCKKTGVSSFILNREFTKITGMSVSKYIKNVKMNHAKKLLEKTYLPIYDIAEKIGYKNATHFSDAFKKHFNRLPKTVRE